MTITALHPVPGIEEILDKFRFLIDSVRPEVLEREAELHGIALALSSANHCLFLGNPGTGKTFIVDRAMYRIESVNYFRTMLHNFSGPADVEGPLDLVALRAGHHSRMPKGFLPDADVSFIDEWGRANHSVLNIFLPIYNKEGWRNNGKWNKTPLKTSFMASNTLPTDEELAAIYDRVALRYVTERIAEPGNFKKVLQLSIPDLDDLEKVISWAEVLELQRFVRTVTFAPIVFDVLTDIRAVLFEEHNLEVSDRRFRMLLPILQAEAALDGRTEVEVEDISIATNVLWDRPEDRTTIDAVVLDKSNPLQKETNSLLHDIQLITDIAKRAADITDVQERISHTMEAHGKIKEAFAEVLTLEEKAGSSKARQLVDTAKDRVRTLAGDVAVLMGADRAVAEKMLASVAEERATKKAVMAKETKGKP